MIAGGRAVGVECLDQQVRVRRAVLASVGAEQLYGGLVGNDELPRRTVTRMREFRRDPATFKIDYALSGPVPWASPPAYAPGTVHIADSYDDMITYFGHLAAGVDPGSAVPADRPDDHHGPDPIARGHRVDVGLHPCPAAGTGRRGRCADRVLGHEMRRSASPTGCRR